MIYCLVIWHSYGQWSIYRFLLMISPINMVILHGYVKSPEGISAVHPWFLDSKNELVGPKAPKKAIQWPPGSGPPLRSVESPILDADGLNPDLHWVKHGEKSDIYDGSWNIKYRLIDENNKLNHIVFSLYHYIYYIYILYYQYDIPMFDLQKPRASPGTIVGWLPTRPSFPRPTSSDASCVNAWDWRRRWPAGSTCLEHSQMVGSLFGLDLGNLRGKFQGRMW